MSIETPKVEESAPIVTKPVESTTTPAETSTPAMAEPTESAAPAATEPATESAATETSATEAVVEAAPATEGVLGYKAPGLLNMFRYVKHFFWFSEQPLTQEALDAYIKNEKAEIAHSHAAWAQETGRGVLFYAKRAEDKANPTGLIILADAVAVTKVGTTDFSFKVGNHTHKFEASSIAERDSWVVAIQKIVEESKDLKADVTGRESYKKTIEGYSFSPIIAGAAATQAKTETPKKSLDAETATAAATAPTEPSKKDDSASSTSSVDKKEKKAAEKAAKKERSQSRKRNSVFGLFGKKDEEKAEKKAEKEHEKEVKKAEKESIKEEKKAEAEQKKEEAKEEHDASKAKEAAEAAAVVAVPAAAVTAAEKEEDKKEEKPAEEVSTPTEKKTKRASVFGGFFGKNKVTSPSVEKSEKEAAPEVPAKDETPAVAESAPKLDEPIDTKPLDAAAVTAPVDQPESSVVEPTPAAVATEEPKPTEAAVIPESTTSPRSEKKSFLSGFMKKHEKKEEVKEEKTNEEAAKETAPIAAPETFVDSATETPIKETEAPKEERPAREKRRTSLFGSLGTLKRKSDKSPAPEPSSIATEENKTVEPTKREKSPMPSKLGGLFRMPSRAHKSETPAEEVKTDATDATKPEPVTEETTETPAATETPANTTVVEPKGESGIVGDVVPENLHSTIHDAVTNEQPSEVKATA